MAELKLKVLMDAVDRMSAPFRSARQSTDQMKVALKGATEQVRSLEKASASIEAFGRLKNESRANASALASAQEKAQKMGRELAEAGGGSRKAQAAFAAARREVNRLEAAQISIARETAILRQRLADSGIDTRKLASAQQQLKRDLDAARQAAIKQGSALDAARAKTEALANARKKLAGAQELQGKLAVGGAVGMGVGGGAIAAGLPMIGGAGDFQHQLAAYGLTAGQTGSQLQAVRDKVRELSAQVNQSSTDLLEGQSILVGKGLDPDKALGAIGTIGRAVTATGAEMADMSNLAFAAMDNLKVPQAELVKAFDIMAKSGDLGGFELKNMSAAFPQLTAAASMLGMTGTKSIGTLSAALQIATKGAADPTTAANNFANFLQKATSPDTVKNFEKKGIDIKAALQQGLMDGQDPIDVMMKKIGQAVGVDFEKEISDAVAGGSTAQAAAEQLAAKFNLGELFGDAQVQNFLAPMMANMKEFRRIRDESMNSDGTVDKKFAIMMETYNDTTKGLGVDLKNMMEGIGATMLPVLTPLMRGLRGLVQGVTGFATANPRLTATLVTVAGVLAAVVAAGGAVSIAIAGMLGPFAMARFALSVIGLNGGMAAGALGLLRGGLGLLGSAASTLFPMLIAGIRAVGMAFLMNPIGLVITAIIAGLGLLYATFEPFQKLVDGIFEKIKGIFGFAGKKMPLAEAAETAKAVPTAAPVKIAATTAMAAAVAAPLAAAPAPAPIDMGGVTIVVQAAPGQSEEEIAKAVRRELEKLERRKRSEANGRMYDGEK